MAAIIELSDVAIRFPGATTPVIENLSLNIQHGEFTTLVGASGAGKSTLLRVITGLLPAAGGDVKVHAAAKPNTRPIAMVFQEARLMPWRRVYENVALGLEGLTLTAFERDARISAALALVELHGLGERWPHELSGGQRQRVGIARALAVEPDLLLMDEPFGALDAITRQALQDELLRIWQRTAKSILFVTHDIDEAIYLGDRVLLLGGTPAQVRGIHTVDMPRPRARGSARLGQLAAQVKTDLFGLVQDGAGI